MLKKTKKKKKMISSENPLTGSFYVEINLRKQKRLISCSCNPNKSVIGQHVEALSKRMDQFMRILFF